MKSEDDIDGEVGGALFMMSGAETRLSFTSDIDSPRPPSSREKCIPSPTPSPRQSPRPKPKPRSSPRSFRELKAIAQSQRRFSGSIDGEERRESEGEEAERELTLAEQFQQLQGCRYIRRREDGKTEEEQGEIDLDDVFGKK